MNTLRDNGATRPELIQVSQPSWAPIFVAFGTALAVCGIFAEGFMVRGWIYSIIGVIVLLAGLRAIVRTAVRDYYRLPRRQKARGAVLPVKTISPPRS